MASRRGWFIALAVGWLVLDQLTKLAVLTAVQTPGRHATVVPGCLDLTLTYNRGAAFGMLHNVAGARLLFVAVAGAALVAVVCWQRAILVLPAVQRHGLALVTAGAAGNLLDRLFRDGAVVDFIHFYLPRYNFVWPDFNVADIGVTCGMAAFVLHSVWSDWRVTRGAGVAADAGPA
ncbi:MAG: signal peptidase II [Fimbriimonadaceae bacterium]|nr:signal peptidase II [Fimbriimonadaceae bacterium]